jgi:transcription elongation factor GreB
MTNQLYSADGVYSSRLRCLIFFGASVTLLKGEAGEETRWRVVGPDDFDLARALLGKRLDHEVRLNNPSGEQVRCVTAIHYGQAAQH